MLITEDNYQLMLMACDANDEIAVDTETSGLDVRNGRDYLMGICLSVPGMKGYLPFRHKTGNLPKRVLFDHLLPILQKKDLIWHNRKFDMHSFKTIGIDPLTFKGKQWDTLMMAHLVNEEWYSKELDALSKMLLKRDKKDKDELHKWGKILGYANLTPEMFNQYGAEDAELTGALKWELLPRLIKQELLEVYQVEEDFTRILYKLEQRGVGVHKDFCAQKAEIGEKRLSEIENELGFNVASGPQLGKFMLEELGLPILKHTDSCPSCRAGESLESHEWTPSFAKKVMEEYDLLLQESNNPTAKLVGEFRGWQKAVSSLYLPMLEKVGPDGRIRTDFRQAGTTSGRISSSNPNLQQLPRGSDKPWNGDAKRAFHAGREGFSILGWDYSQLELRLAADYGEEDGLRREFESTDADPFSYLAPRIFGVLTPETRHDTKTFVYANLYGAGLRKIASQLGRSLNETEDLYAKYHSSIPGIMAVSKAVAGIVEQRGWVRYWDGRRRHFRNKSDSYKGWNAVCQGGGAQLVKRAMIRCEQFEDEHCEMRLQVHDEITFAIEDGYRDKYEPEIIKAMTDWPQFSVKMHVEGKEWGK
jgi:DNA polymerase-1